MFIAGILLYEAMESRHIPTPHSLHGLLALVFGLLALLLPVAGSAGITLKEVILFCSFFLLCLTCFREPSAWLPRAFTWTPLRWLGNMSYSYYLLHGLVLKAGFLLLATLLPLESLGAWAYWALLPVMFALTVPPSVVLFLVVERPFSLAPRKIT